MAKYKRYFPVSHDIFFDPEIIELVKKFGAPGLLIWLAILSQTDRTEGRLKANRYWLESVCKLASCRLATGLLAVNHAVVHGWLTPNQPFTTDSETVYIVSNYAEYHRTCARNVDELGNENKKIGVPPTFLPSKEKNKTARARVQRPSLRSVEEEEKSAVPGCEVPNNSGKTKGQQSADLPDYIPAAFEELWDMWPRKEGYGAAKKAWNKLQLPKDMIRQIFIDVPNWKNYTWKQYTSVTFIKKLENWLLEEGYRDRPPRRIIC